MAKRCGRPTKLTAELQEQIVNDIRTGNYAEVAATRAGIDESTFYRWMQQGEDGRAAFREFRKAIRAAEAHAQADAVAVVRAAFPKDWKTAAW